MFYNIYQTHKLLIVSFAILVTVPASICQSKETNDPVLEAWGSTDIIISKVKYMWTINNLKFCCQKINEIIKSPIFMTDDKCKWYLDIRPKGTSEADKDYVSLYLAAVNCNSSAVVKFSILNAKGDQTAIFEFSHIYEVGQVWGRQKYILQSKLFKEENDLLPDNQLTIICDLTVTLDKKSYTGQFLQPKGHLAEDLGLLLENEVMTDITLVAGGKEFQAHKAILLARSPFFKGRFDDELKYSNNTRIEINHVDSKSLSAMLRYIYTDENVCDSEKVAPNLLVAAEIFKLGRLKTMCETTLRSKLAIENAVDLYMLADKYRAAELKQEAKQFIVVHASQILNTTGFKSLIITQPRLAAETFDILG